MIERWAKAWEQLRAILPGAKYATTDAVCEHAESVGATCDVRVIRGSRMMTAREFAEVLSARLPDIGGEVVVITDASFPEESNGPSVFEGPAAMEGILAMPDSSFDGDVIVLVPSAKMIVAFRDDGDYRLIAFVDAGAIH